MEPVKKECIMLNFQDEVNKRRYKATEERFFHLSDHLFDNTKKAELHKAFVNNIITNSKSF